MGLVRIQNMQYARSRGMGTIGVLVIVVMVIGYLRLMLDLWTPVTQDLKIKSILEDLAAEPETSELSPKALRTRLGRRLNLNSLRAIGDKEIKYKRATEKRDATLGIQKDYEVVLVESKVVLVYKVEHSVSIEKP